MKSTLNADKGTTIRALIRATVVLITAFGLKLSPEQIGAIQLFSEAVLQAGVVFTNSPSEDQ